MRDGKLVHTSIKKEELPSRGRGKRRPGKEKMGRGQNNRPGRANEDKGQGEAEKKT